MLLPSSPWGGWLDEAFSSAEARRVRGSRLLSNLILDTAPFHAPGFFGMYWTPSISAKSES
jgi:hypothetical protein